ncbi:MAG: TonB-dependent receptor [Elusimicrobia bacterium]|nr:TonB-dependent receptor [Elusimicrobiota bacterium]
MTPARPRRLPTLALLWAFSAAASGAEIPRLKKLSLEELLDVPITAASSVQERPSAAPWSARVVTEETIAARGYATLLDLLEELPELEVQRKASERRLNLVSVRGLLGNERLVILYDGVRVTPATGDTYALSSQFSLRGAKRVEIALGPMSALYGADAFSGVINVVTKKGGELDGARLSGGHGQHGTSDASLSAGSTFPAGGELSVTAHRRASDEAHLPGIYPGDYAGAPPVPAPRYEAGTGSLFLNARLNIQRFELGVLRFTESHPSGTGVKPEFTLYGDAQRFRTEHGALYAKHALSSDDDRWTFEAMSSLTTYEIDPKTRFNNRFSLFRDAYKYAYDRTVELHGKVTYRLAEEAPLVAGLVYSDHSSLAYTNDLDHPFDPGQSGPSQGYLFPGSNVVDLNGKALGIPLDFHHLHYENVGVFAQLGLRRGPWNVALGTRFDHNTRYGDSVNPRVGVAVEPAERLTLKANYGEAFLAPAPFRTHGEFGSFSPVTNGLGQVTGLESSFINTANPGLRPEKLRAWDAGACFRFSDGLWASLDGWYTEISNLIQDNVVSGPGTFKGWPVASMATTVNRGFARTYGWTARLDALALAGAWSIKPNASLSYTNGSVDGEVLPYSARHAAQAGVEARLGRLSLYPRVLYRGRTYSATRDPQGGLQSSAPYAVVNAHARMADLVARPFRLSAYLGASNLLDTRYRNAANTVASVGFPASPQDPVRFVGGVEVEF